jgi:hypothetical protein
MDSKLVYTKCTTCTFWKVLTWSPIKGLCIKYAPKVIGFENPKTVFPTTTDGDGCFEGLKNEKSEQNE